MLGLYLPDQLPDLVSILLLLCLLLLLLLGHVMSLRGHEWSWKVEFQDLHAGPGPS